jgi:hypothetical protein
VIGRQFAFASPCQASAETVLALLDDVDGWSAWARPLVMQTRWERWGESSTAGPGAIRKVGAWPVWIRELILTRDDGGQTYTVVSPSAFTRYLGSITVRPAAAGGVDIEWRIEFVAKRRLAAPLLNALLQKTIAGLLARLVGAAEKPSAREERSRYA